MATDRINDPRAFKGFIEDRLALADDVPTLEETLLDWELDNQGDTELKETLEAIGDARAEIVEFLGHDPDPELRRIAAEARKPVVHHDPTFGDLHGAPIQIGGALAEGPTLAEIVEDD